MPRGEAEAAGGEFVDPEPAAELPGGQASRSPTGRLATGLGQEGGTELRATGRRRSRKTAINCPTWRAIALPRSFFCEGEGGDPSRCVTVVSTNIDGSESTLTCGGGRRLGMALNLAVFG
ncbi:MAG: hypothetical protein QOH85_1329 [Acidobacteriaceae bacterium]|nr:hypothetical protein [Acidobacteriaceae bacterium]